MVENSDYCHSRSLKQVQEIFDTLHIGDYNYSCNKILSG